MRESEETTPSTSNVSAPPQPSASAAPGSARVSELRDLLAEPVSAVADDDARIPEMDDGWFSAVGMLVTDAVLEADRDSLKTARDELLHCVAMIGDESSVAGRLLGLADVVSWGLQRVGAAAAVRQLDPGSHSYRFLNAVAVMPGSTNSQLRRVLGLDETEVSRVGRRLLTSGLAERVRVGRNNNWELTPLGRQALASTQVSGRRLVESDERTNGDNRRLALGVDVARDALLAAVVTSQGTVVASQYGEWETAARTPDQVMRFVTTFLSMYPAADRIAAAAVAIGGHVDSRRGHVVLAPKYGDNEHWRGTRANDFLGAGIASSYIVNDAHALLVGSGCDATDVRQPMDDLLVVLVGDTGIGAACSTNGMLIEGVHGGAGELGHVVVDPMGRRCSCGKHGCLETFSSIESICYSVSLMTGTRTKGLNDVLSLLDDKREDAREAVRAAGVALGEGLSTALNLLNPRTAVVYGPRDLVISNETLLAEEFTGGVAHAFNQHSYSSLARDCQLIFRELESNRIAVGAAIFALASSDAGAGHVVTVGTGGTEADSAAFRSEPNVRVAP